MECILVGIHLYIIINTNCLAQIVKVTDLNLIGTVAEIKDSHDRF